MLPWINITLVYTFKNQNESLPLENRVQLRTNCGLIPILNILLN